MQVYFRIKNKGKVKKALESRKSKLLGYGFLVSYYVVDWEDIEYKIFLWGWAPCYKIKFLVIFLLPELSA